MTEKKHNELVRINEWFQEMKLKEIAMYWKKHTIYTNKSKTLFMDSKTGIIEDSLPNMEPYVTLYGHVFEMDMVNHFRNNRFMQHMLEIKQMVGRDETTNRLRELLYDYDALYEDNPEYGFNIKEIRLSRDSENIVNKILSNERDEMKLILNSFDTIKKNINQSCVERKERVRCCTVS